MSLVRHGLADKALWLTDGGFALLRGHDLDMAVAPDSRGHGDGRALAEAAIDRAPRRSDGLVARRPSGGGRAGRRVRVLGHAGRCG